MRQEQFGWFPSASFKDRLALCNSVGQLINFMNVSMFSSGLTHPGIFYDKNSS